MLVLTRKQDECVMIGEEIEVKIIRVQSGRVQIGIAASRDISILRGELQPRLTCERFEIDSRTTEIIQNSGATS